MSNGPLLTRYTAGFISRTIAMTADLPAKFLNPVTLSLMLRNGALWTHVHASRSLRDIWPFWISEFKGGAYGLGALTADALIAESLRSRFTEPKPQPETDMSALMDAFWQDPLHTLRSHPVRAIKRASREISNR